jgi:hypothetical protein
MNSDVLNSSLDECKSPDDTIILENRQNSINSMRHQLRRQQQLSQRQHDLLLSVAINIFELGVSCHYIKLFRALLGRDISEGHVGLMGVTSSTLILYEGYIAVSRELQSEGEKNSQ